LKNLCAEGLWKDKEEDRRNMRIFQGLPKKYLGSRASRIIQELIGGAIYAPEYRRKAKFPKLPQGSFDVIQIFSQGIDK